MTISMHSASAPVFVRTLTAMLTWLDKAQAHAETRKFETTQYLGLRLAPDMLPFTRQIQICSDAAKGCMGRLAGIELPKWEDNEASFDDIRARIRKTIDFVQTVSAAQVDGTEQKDIVIKMRAGDVTMKGEDYLRHFAMANFFFHATTAYNLLRQAGVDIGKKDFLA